MGRSVMTLSDATSIAYQTFKPSHYCDEHEDFDCGCDIYCDANCDHSEEFRDLLTWIEERVIELWSSFTGTDRWIGNELHVIAENAHSVIAVAEYMGMVSINLGPNYDRDTFWRDDNALGEHWRKQISARFEKEFSEFTKLGTFSNGESVYQKIGA